MLYQILDSSQSRLWNDYLSYFPPNYQDIYYTCEYYKLYEEYGDGIAHCFIYQVKDKIIMYPFLKNCVNDLGYKLEKQYFDIQGAYGYNGFLCNSDDENFLKEFHKLFHDFCIEENIIAEFTRFNPLLKNQELSKDYMNVIFDRQTVFLEISKTTDEIWKNSYSSNNRNMIRKALKNNVEIVVSQNKADYIEFYKIYTETMKNVSSETHLYFNEKYFLNFITLLPSNHKLILAKFENKIIGGMILMFFNDFAHYHLSCRKIEFGKFALNNLFLDYAIKESKKMGCKYFHLGGGTTSNESDSLLKFKSNFSKDKIDFFIGKRIHNNEIYDLVVNVWNKYNQLRKDKLKNVLLKYRM